MVYLWYMKEVDLDKVKTLVNSYKERDPESSSVALGRIRLALEPIVEDTKVWLKIMRLPHSLNPKPDFVATVEVAPLSLYVLELLKLLESDFLLLKGLLDGTELTRSGENGEFRLTLLNGTMSRMDKTLADLEAEEKKTQKEEDVGQLIWETRQSTLDQLITTLVLKTESQNLQKLTRIQETLSCVYNSIRDWIVAHPHCQLEEPKPLQPLGPQIEYGNDLVGSEYYLYCQDPIPKPNRTLSTDHTCF